MPTNKHILLRGERISFNAAYKSLIIGEGVLHGTCLASRPPNVQICLKGFIDGARDRKELVAKADIAWMLPDQHRPDQHTVPPERAERAPSFLGKFVS